MADLPIPAQRTTELPIPVTDPVVTPEQADIQAFTATAGSIRRGFRGGLNSLGAMIKNFAGGVGEAIGLRDYAQDRYAEAKQYTDFANAVAPEVRQTGQIKDFDSLMEYVGGHTGQGLATSIPAIAGGLLTRSPAGVMAGSFVPEAGEQIGTLREDPRVMATTTPQQRAANAAGKGAINSMLEMVGGAPAQAVKRVLRPSAQGIVPAVGKAMVGEGLTEGAQNLVGQNLHQQLNPEKKIDLEAAKEEAIAGAVGGGGIGLGGHVVGQVPGLVAKGASELRSRIKREPPPEADAVPTPEELNKLNTPEDIAAWLDGKEEAFKQKWEEVKNSDWAKKFGDAAGRLKDPQGLSEEMKKRWNESDVKPAVDEALAEGKKWVEGVAKYAKERGKPVAKKNLQRTLIDERIIDSVKAYAPKDIPEENLDEFVRIMRTMVSNPDYFSETGVPHSLRRVFGKENFDRLMEEVAYHVHGTEESQYKGPNKDEKDALRAVKTVLTKKKVEDMDRMEAIRDVFRRKMRPEYFRDKGMRDEIMGLAPDVLDYLHSPTGMAPSEAPLSDKAEETATPQMSERAAHFRRAFHDIFGENHDDAMAELESVLEIRPPDAFFEAKDPSEVAPVLKDERLNKSYPFEEAAQVMRGLQKDYGRKAAKFVPIKDLHGDNWSIVAEPADAEEGLTDEEYESVRESEKTKASGLANGIWVVRGKTNSTTVDHKINLVNLTKLMMQKEGQQTQGTQLEYVADMFARGISTLVGSPRFRGLTARDAWNFTDDTLVAITRNEDGSLRRWTYGEIKEAGFDQSPGAVRARTRDLEEDERRSQVVSDYHNYKAEIRREVDARLETALDDLHDAGTSGSYTGELVMDVTERLRLEKAYISNAAERKARAIENIKSISSKLKGMHPRDPARDDVFKALKAAQKHNKALPAPEYLKLLYIESALATIDIEAERMFSERSSVDADEPGNYIKTALEDERQFAIKDLLRSDLDQGGRTYDEETLLPLHRQAEPGQSGKNEDPGRVTSLAQIEDDIARLEMAHERNEKEFEAKHNPDEPTGSLKETSIHTAKQLELEIKLTDLHREADRIINEAIEGLYTPAKKSGVGRVTPEFNEPTKVVIDAAPEPPKKATLKDIAQIKRDLKQYNKQAKELLNQMNVLDEINDIVGTPQSEMDETQLAALQEYTDLEEQYNTVNDLAIEAKTALNEAVRRQEKNKKDYDPHVAQDVGPKKPDTGPERADIAVDYPAQHPNLSPLRKIEAEGRLRDKAVKDAVETPPVGPVDEIKIGKDVGEVMGKLLSAESRRDLLRPFKDVEFKEKDGNFVAARGPLFTIINGAGSGAWGVSILYSGSVVYTETKLSSKQEAIEMINGKLSDLDYNEKKLEEFASRSVGTPLPKKAVEILNSGGTAKDLLESIRGEKIPPVTARFLNFMSSLKVLDEVRVKNERKLGSPAVGSYQARLHKDGKVNDRELRLDAENAKLHDLAHELVHTATIAMLTQPLDAQKPIIDALDGLREIVYTGMNRLIAEDKVTMDDVNKHNLFYSNEDVHEFVAEYFSNKKLREVMDMIHLTDKQIKDVLVLIGTSVIAARELAGLETHTSADTAEAAISELFSRAEKRATETKENSIGAAIPLLIHELMKIDKASFGNVRMSRMNTNGKAATPKEIKELRDYIEKTLGKSVKTDQLIQNMAEAGSFAEMSGEEVIRISAHAADKMGVAYHESMHAFFARLMQADPKAAHILTRAASSATVVARLNELLKGHPDALAQLSDPEERLAYMYQFWATGKKGLVPVGPNTNTLFQKIKAFFNKIAAIWADDIKDAEAVERAGEMFNAFHGGQFADRNTVAQVLHEKFPETASDKADRIFPALRGFMDKFVYTAKGVMTDINIPEVLEIAEKFHSQNSGKPGFLQAKHVEQNKRINQLVKVLEGTTKVEQDKLLEELRSGKDTVSPKAQAVRDMLDELHDYMVNAGVMRFATDKDGKIIAGKTGPQYEPIGKIKKYFPRVFDTEAILKDVDGFKAMLKKHGVMDPDGVVATLTKDQNHKPNEEDYVIGLTYFTPATNKRTLKDVPDAALAPYMVNDLYSTMAEYISRAARRAEYTRRFGNAGEEIAEAKKEALAKGMTRKQEESFDMAVQAMEGSLGGNMTKEAKNFFGALMTYQNVRLLPLALFSSLIDPMGIAIRGGSMRDAGAAFARGIKDLFGVNKDEAYQLATTIGAISASTDMSMMADLYGSSYMAPTLRKINDQFFKYNGMESWNRSMRVAAAAAGEQFIIRHAKSRSAQSTRYLSELGLTQKDVKTASGKLVLTPAVEKALNLWVDGAVIRPNAAQRPAYMSDPNWMLISHLKQYTYMFQKTILARVQHEAANGNFLPAYRLASYVPIIIMADIAKAMLTPGGADDERLKKLTAGDWLWRGVQRAGLIGPSQLALDTSTDFSYNKLGIESLAGPTIQQFMDLSRAAMTGEGLPNEALKAIPGLNLFR